MQLSLHNAKRKAIFCLIRGNSMCGKSFARVPLVDNLAGGAYS